MATGRVIDSLEVDNLPLTSRNPYNFVLFQPGVSGHPNPELGVPRMVNTNGLDNRVQYQMDGMVDTESDQYGLRLFAISDSYVREVQAVSNSFAPEFGRTSGDIYNAITNSGSNDFHGEFYFIGRPPGSARTILLASNQPNTNIDLHDFAANAGGRIKKDKLFIFGAYEHLLRGTPTPVTITPANAAAIGLPGTQLATAATVQHVQFLDVRVDWNINSKNQFFARYNYFRNEYPFNSKNGGLNALSARRIFTTARTSAACNSSPPFRPPCSTNCAPPGRIEMSTTLPIRLPVPAPPSPSPASRTSAAATGAEPASRKRYPALTTTSPSHWRSHVQGGLRLPAEQRQTG